MRSYSAGAGAGAALRHPALASCGQPSTAYQLWPRKLYGIDWPANGSQPPAKLAGVSASSVALALAVSWAACNVASMSARLFGYSMRQLQKYRRQWRRQCLADQLGGQYCLENESGYLSVAVGLAWPSSASQCSWPQCGWQKAA